MSRRWAFLLILWLAACGGAAAPTPQNTPENSEFITAEPGTVSFEVSGSITLNVPNAQSEFNFLDTSQRIQFNISDTEDKYLLLLILPEAPQPGTHPLASYADNAQYIAAFTPALADESNIFGESVSGSITLETAGDRFSGSFQFTAQNPAGEQITVRGTFRDVPLVFG